VGVRVSPGAPGVQASSIAMPLTYAIFLRSRGTSDYKPAGHVPLAAAPARGEALAFERDGSAVHGVVDEIFIPPGCEENCIATVFVSER
jgi:hypothetical protein